MWPLYIYILYIYKIIYTIYCTYSSYIYIYTIYTYTWVIWEIWPEQATGNDSVFFAIQPRILEHFSCWKCIDLLPLSPAITSTFFKANSGFPVFCSFDVTFSCLSFDLHSNLEAANSTSRCQKVICMHLPVNPIGFSYVGSVVMRL